MSRPPPHPSPCPIPLLLPLPSRGSSPPGNPSAVGGLQGWLCSGSLEQLRALRETCSPGGGPLESLGVSSGLVGVWTWGAPGRCGAQGEAAGKEHPWALSDSWPHAAPGCATLRLGARGRNGGGPVTAGAPTSGRGSLAGRAGEPRPLSPSRSFPRNPVTFLLG